MRITVSVRIDQEASDQAVGGYGSMNFNEEASLSNAGFDSVSKVFVRLHELLQTLKNEHAGKGGTRQ